MLYSAEKQGFFYCYILNEIKQLNI